ncbi:MAG: hypothetical protein AUJ96_16155 [Armatimonadetes bacterium CG2_30_66_41]|nr:MAG: hypothetical protein AUJ96_16155 [Armatimonadetes bacterium CG2_30_66_41]
MLGRRSTAVPTTQTLRDQLAYLVRATERPESLIVADAVETGLAQLCRKQLADSYLAGGLRREEAVAELGPEAVEDLDYARRAVEQDVAWGLHGG